ncbi:MAG: 4-(cytidine 5-diphospho)-2-C-methyl-D-erythritol kinase [Clostridiales bacterium]|jgi:4-diphosphocytidyl-2-C-methyl-D-erythritol kinase|nr:4-(cytidine 5-diphospho)-2-C-methyl-D-erythritol kinase [Clostridiales bacterium]
MDKIIVKCPGKINLSLDVVGIREDGYHLLKTIMQNISLFDEVKIKKTEGDINLYCNNGNVPCNSSNTAYKAASILIDKFHLKAGVDIVIEKRIPVAAGLAGGSADAAGVIIGMNELFELGMSDEDMMRIGVRIGADVPFCIIGSTALAEGIGEVLTPLCSLEDMWCVLAKPDIAISTMEVYAKLKIDEIPKHPNTLKLKEYIEKKEIKNMAQNMVNVLENVTIKENPVIFNIKNIMMEFQALGSLMSGSGPTVFGVFEDKISAEGCYNRLRDYLKEVFLVKTYNRRV